MKLFRLSFVLVLSALAVSAQNVTPDLSGTWQYAERNSPFKDRVLVIKQAGDEIQMLETYEFKNVPYSQNVTLYTDNRGEANLKQFPGGGQPSQVESNTTWKKGKLFRKLRYTYTMDSRGTQYQVKVVEEQSWSLSKDGDTLTINIRSTRDAQAMAPIPVPTTGRSTYRRKK